MNRTKSFWMACVFALTIATSPGNAQIQYSSYTCDPDSCFDIAEGTGNFFSGITVTGVWLIGDENPIKRYKTAKAEIMSLGCTQTVTIESLGYDTVNIFFGEGVLADAVGSQGGVQLLHGQQVKYFVGSSSFTEPSPAVPCL